MKDIELWRRLSTDPIVVDEGLVQLLEELAARPLALRAPFISGLRRLLEHPDPGLRVAALRALAGASGHAGLELLTQALDDEAATVRAAAVGAMVESSRAQPWRWAHVVFHPREDVRAHALRANVPEPQAHMGVYLLADPGNAESAAAAPWPANPVALAFDMFARGFIGPGVVTERLAAGPISELRTFLLHGQRRSEVEVDDWLSANLASGSLGPAGGFDLFDLWCRAWDREHPRAEQALANLRQAVLGERLARLRRRAAVAFLQDAFSPERRASPGAQASDGLDICVACEPRVLGLDALGLPQRREAARVLLRRGFKVPRVSESVVKGLWDTRPCVETPAAPGELALDAGLHLSTAACVAALLPRRRVAAMINHYGLAAVRHAVDQSNAGWMDLCRLPQETKGGALVLLGSFRRKDHARYEQLLAAALGTWMGPEPKRAYEVIGRRVRGNLATRVLLQLFGLLISGELSVGDNALRKLLGRLVEKVPDEELSLLVERTLGFAGDLDEDTTVFTLRRVAARVEPTAWALATCGLGEDALDHLLRLLEGPLLVPLDHEKALARALSKHAQADARTWSQAVLRPGPSPRGNAALRSAGKRILSDEEIERIASCPEGELDAAVQPALRAPAGGLCRALSAREPSQSVAVCTALVACTDPEAEVAGQLERFANERPGADDALHTSCVRAWQSNPNLPPLGHALLHRWEAHAFAFAKWFEGKGESLGAAHIEQRLLEMNSWPGELAKRVVWGAMASVILLRRYREPAYMAYWASGALVHAALQELDTSVGPAAARVLTALHLSGVAGAALAAVEEAVREVGPDLDAATRLELSRWISFDGMPARRAPARRSSVELPKDVLERIKGCEDLDTLELYCRRGDTRVVHEACLRLVMMGRAGQLRVLALLDVRPELPGIDAFLDSVALWTDAGCVAAVRVMAIDPRHQAAFRFRLCLALADRGERGFIEHALGVLRQPVPGDQWGWFHRKLRNRLSRSVGDGRRFALALADSPHPHAHRQAIVWLLDNCPAGEGGFEDGDITAAMWRFLEAGTQRPQELRRKTARRLFDLGHREGLQPIVVGDLVHADFPDGPGWMSAWRREGAQGLTQVVVDAALLGGEQVCAESRAYAVTGMAGAAAESVTAWQRSLLDHGVDDSVRSLLVRKMEAAGAKERKTRRVAEVFAWGIRRGRELTGRLFKVHMTDKRADFGYTFLDQRRIYVSALPIFRGDRHGGDIVEGLLLHEIGHHMFHAGSGNDKVWRRAQREGLHKVLNLVADEHLERNLRAIDPLYGDRLKRLCAYAFAHSARELQVQAALNMLMGAAFEVLTAERLGVAFDPQCVQVERGALLRELDHRGHGFARFVRALRMGLGDRHQDEQLQRALALFRGGFRHHDMEGLYEVVLKLAQIYGGKQALAEVFGGHEDLEWEGRDAEAHGSGVEDEAVQREVERILDPKRNKGKPTKGGGRLAINVAEDAHFDIIEAVERVPPDRERHRALAKELRRFANRLREYMMRLGLAHKSMRARLRGRAFDRTRAQAVVVRRDPRMLVAREMRIDTDLFVGVVVDCSGSMSVGGSMEKAHRFGVLIAEAVHRLDGVDARFFGFTDRLIYDAGDAENCAVTSLEPTGGNNDAAGLWHVARVAAASTRRAKLLVMISDGLPTECSVQALRALVQQLGRKGMVCAQVAVRPLEEVCFPHYVVLDDEDMNDSVRKFGEIVTKLVGRALGR